MDIRYLIELGILILISIVGITIKMYTKKKLKDIDGFGGVHKKDNKGKNIIEDIGSDGETKD